MVQQSEWDGGERRGRGRQNSHTDVGEMLATDELHGRVHSYFSSDF